MAGGRPRKPVAPPRRRARGTGSVGTRADGRVYAALPPDCDPGRRPHYGPGNRRRFADEAEARAWLAAEAARLRAHPGAAHPGEQLGAYLTRWLKIYGPAMPPRTRAAYTVALRHWLPHAGTVTLGALTHEHLQGALAAMQAAGWVRYRRDGSPIGTARPYSPRTLAHALAVLRHALAAMVPDVLATNPCRRVRLARSQPAEAPVWDAAEAEAFIAAAEVAVPHLALAYKLILRRGLRRGEVVALQWADVRAHEGLLTVDETAGTRAGTAGGTKGRRTRDIPLSGAQVAEFAAHRAAQARPGRYVFTNPRTGTGYSVSALGRHVARLAALAGVPPIGLKDMRATCSTTLLDEGIPLPRVSRLLGHADARVTAQHYDRVIAARADRVTRVADELDAAYARAAEAARQHRPRPLHDTGTD